MKKFKNGDIVVSESTGKLYKILSTENGIRAKAWTGTEVKGRLVILHGENLVPTRFLYGIGA